MLVVVPFERNDTARSFVPVLSILAGVVVVLSTFYLLALRSSTRFKLQGYVQLSIDLVLVTWLVYLTGDVESSFLALYLVIIFAASTLFGRPGVSLLGASAAVMYAAIGLLTMSALVERARGWQAYDFKSLAWAEFMFSLNLIAIFAIAALSSHLAERIRRSESQLATATSELATATKELADNRLVNDRIIESMRSGLVTTDLRGDILTFNRAAEEITGYKVQDV